MYHVHVLSSMASLSVHMFLRLISHSLFFIADLSSIIYTVDITFECFEYRYDVYMLKNVYNGAMYKYVQIKVCSLIHTYLSQGVNSSNLVSVCQKGMTINLPKMQIIVIPVDFWFYNNHYDYR